MNSRTRGPQGSTSRLVGIASMVMALVGPRCGALAAVAGVLGSGIGTGAVDNAADAGFSPVLDRIRELYAMSCGHAAAVLADELARNTIATAPLDGEFNRRIHARRIREAARDLIDDPFDGSVREELLELLLSTHRPISRKSSREAGR